jgi:hypothetical protein
VQIPNGPELQPNEEFEINASAYDLNNLVLTLPGNDIFDFINSRYTKSSYYFMLKRCM